MPGLRPAGDFSAMEDRAHKLEPVRRARFGQRLLLMLQTLDEARYGALKAGWGLARLSRLAQLTAGSRLLPVDLQTIEAAARLRNQCRLMGHALHQRLPNADLRMERSAGRPRCGIPRLSGAGSQD